MAPRRRGGQNRRLAGSFGKAPAAPQPPKPRIPKGPARSGQAQPIITPAPPAMSRGRGVPALPSSAGGAERDAEGYEWISPSPTAWPDVLHRSSGKSTWPPGPRTQVIGYNRDTQTVRIVFRPPARKVTGEADLYAPTGPPARYAYWGVTPDEWELIQGAVFSVGKDLLAPGEMLANKDYARTNFPNPPGGLPPLRGRFR